MQDLGYWWFQGADIWWRGGWASFGLPLCLCLFFVLRGDLPLFRGRFLLEVFACAALTWVSGQWHDDAVAVSLHLMPSALVVTAAWLYWGAPVSAGHAYALTFFSLVLADATSAGLRFGLHDTQWWLGLGGAGLADGLFFFPLMSALLVGYASWRRQGRVLLGAPPEFLIGPRFWRVSATRY